MYIMFYSLRPKNSQLTVYIHSKDNINKKKKKIKDKKKKSPIHVITSCNLSKYNIEDTFILNFEVFVKRQKQQH